MLSEHLIAKLRGRFLSGSYVLAPRDQVVVRFPAAHPDFGDLEVCDDGDELTVYVGKFTHVHFGNYESDLAEAERDQRVAGEVVDFLADVLADRVECFGGRFGGGGCRPRSERPRGFVSKLLLGRRTWVWSGPLD